MYPNNYLLRMKGINGFPTLLQLFMAWNLLLSRTRLLRCPESDMHAINIGFTYQRSLCCFEDNVLLVGELSTPGWS